MDFRVVYIANPCSLNFKNNSLVVKNEQGETNVPLNDISTILIDNLQVNISAFLLSKISESKIVLIIVDERHLPCGVLLPFSGKVRMMEAYNYQMSLKDDFIGDLWKKIVKNKIENQAKVLEFGNQLSFIKLKNYTLELKPHDSTNIEGSSALLYWKMIFSNSLDYFTRNKDDIRNSSLNYGYAILRSIIANSLTCKGFILHQGIHHKNQQNQFNLADDIIEPFRPFVDLEVYNMFELEGIDEENLTKDIKKRLLSIVDATVLINNEKFTMLNAIDKYTDSLFNSFKKQNINELIEVSIWI